jgi:hypothetical protein
MTRNLSRDENIEGRGHSREEYRVFRDGLEALSENVGLLRNHFYNHAFNNGTLLKVAEVRKIAEKFMS